MSGGVRARKSGLGADIEKKMEQRYDEEEELGIPARIVEWINQALEGQHDPCPGASWQEIQAYLKNGVALCKLINVLSAQINLPKTAFKAKADMAFVAMGNIENFNKACIAYGVKESALFQTADLVEGRKAVLLNVINSLNQLGVTANTKGFTPAYVPTAQRKVDQDLYGPLD